MTEAATFPIWLSLRVALMALAIVVPFGIALAWLQAWGRYRLRPLVDALILLPLVLPPSVIGFFLVIVFGRQGIVGGALERWFDLRIIFTEAAAVVASSVVALPILVKTAQPSIEAVPEELHHVGRSLGLGPLALFTRVTLRWAWRGVVTGIVLAFARAIGEFGATLMFAGNIPGETNTMPVEIFMANQHGEDRLAFLYVALLTAFSTVTVLWATRLSPAREAAR